MCLCKTRVGGWRGCKTREESRSGWLGTTTRYGQQITRYPEPSWTFRKCPAQHKHCATSLRSVCCSLPIYGPGLSQEQPSRYVDALPPNLNIHKEKNDQKIMGKLTMVPLFEIWIVLDKPKYKYGFIAFVESTKYIFYPYFF